MGTRLRKTDRCNHRRAKERRSTGDLGGSPSQRGPKASADSAYLNDLYRSRAEKAGIIIYVDVWDGFVDEAGKFAPQGPDYQGQIRRLRTGDGIHFTKYGARKLALYIGREIERLTSPRIPAALPTPVDQDVHTRKGNLGGTNKPDAGPGVAAYNAERWCGKGFAWRAD
jgi:hypothetical protein